MEMKTTTGPQCQMYFDTGHACPGCEQCAPLPVQAKNEVPMRLPADLYLDLRDAVAVARQRAEKLGNAAMKKRWDAVDERLYAMSLSAAPAAQVQAQPEPHQWMLDTIGGAIAYGRMGANPPPSPEHWLNEYWQIGRQLAKLDETSAWDNVTPADAAAQAQPVAGEERAAFEHHEHASDLTRNPDGSLDDYANPCVQSAWDGWQARAALAAAQPAAASESVDTPEFRKIAWHFNEQDAGTSDANSAFEELIAHIHAWGWGRYIRGYDKRKAEDKPAAPAAPAVQPEAITDSMRFKFVANFDSFRWESKEDEGTILWRYSLHSDYGATEWEDDVRKLVDIQIRSLSKEDFARLAIPASPVAAEVPEGMVLVPKEFVAEVRRAAEIADSYSPSIDSIDEHGGEECEEPIWQIHHILYYAHGKLFASRAAAAPTTKEG